MQDDDRDTHQFPAALVAASTWQTTLLLGVVTLVLGIVVTIHPSGSLNVIAVLVGILVIVSGLFHLVRVFDPAEPHRLWLTISALFLIVIGVVLIRHLHLTVALFGLLIGITWIVQGLSALIGDHRRCPRGQGLVDHLRGGEPDRGDRGRGGPHLLAYRPGCAARYLVRHHGHLRDHRRVHTAARASRHVEGARLSQHSDALPHGKRWACHLSG